MSGIEKRVHATGRKIHMGVHLKTHIHTHRMKFSGSKKEDVN